MWSRHTHIFAWCSLVYGTAREITEEGVKYYTTLFVMQANVRQAAVLCTGTYYTSRNRVFAENFELASVLTAQSQLNARTEQLNDKKAIYPVAFSDCRYRLSVASPVLLVGCCRYACCVK